jgi:6-phosphogluconate dehydrogenase
VYFLAKKPGFEDKVEMQEMHFNMRDIKLSEKYVEEYEKLILDAISGDQTLFVSADEIEASWKFIDAIEEVWAKGQPELEAYTEYTDEAIIKAKAKFETKEFITPIINKEIKIIGLGKMGGNIAIRLARKGWQVEGYDPFQANFTRFESEGIKIQNTIEDLIPKSSSPKIIWIMIPAGKELDNLIFGKDGIIKYLKRGDILIDGGNSHFEDSIERAKILKKYGIHYVDVGVSGGPGGALNGASLMYGGNKQVTDKLKYLFRDLAVEGGFLYAGDSGAGHYVKMVHNGIEYGIMQSIAEGFELLKNSPFHHDLASVAASYNNGSVISSKLISLLSEIYTDEGAELSKIQGEVALTGEAEWATKLAKKYGVKTPAISASIAARKATRNNPTYQGKILSALREKFGGHSVRIKKNKKSI